MVDMTEWIENNLGSTLTTERVAKKSGYSKFYLQRIFKAYTGKSIARYIKSKRLERSISLLKNTDKKIIDIAELLGFDSKQTFIRAFKKNFLITPGHYRSLSKRCLDDGNVQRAYCFPFSSELN